MNDIALNGLAEMDDARLVESSIRGDRAAFGQIVTRHQSLICGLAYSLCGSLARSEELAQETFVTAWKQLEKLKDPSKLRGWLCGITRNLSRGLVRDLGKDPLHQADLLEDHWERLMEETSPLENTVTKEEEAILWRILEDLPPIYREPMILFYRQNESTEAVAEALDLTEEAVRQRMTRGRAQLQDRVARFVKDGLGRSGPTPVFTMGVLAALPVFTKSASAATMGTGAVKGMGSLKTLGWMGVLGVFLGPVAGMGAGLISGWVGIKNGLRQARSEREKKFICRSMGFNMSMFAVALFLTVTPNLIPSHYWKEHYRAFSFTIASGCLLFAAILASTMFWTTHRLRKIREEEGGIADDKANGIPNYEYRSPWKFLGFPLIHIFWTHQLGQKPKPAIGWIAIGNYSIGILFSMGGLALGGISVGGLSAGLFSIGGLALGILTNGGFSIGAFALGGMAMGYLANGGCALAWSMAKGGFAVARDYALGDDAYALHANNALAREVMSHTIFFSLTNKIAFWSNLLIWLPMGMVYWQAVQMLRRKG